MLAPALVETIRSEDELREWLPRERSPLLEDYECNRMLKLLLRPGNYIIGVNSNVLHLWRLAHLMDLFGSVYMASSDETLHDHLSESELLRDERYLQMRRGRERAMTTDE